MKSKNILVGEDQEELIKPILPGLPVSIFKTVFSPNTYNFINWHWHQAFQYCYVESGIVDFLITGHTYTVTAGSGIFINYEQIHFIQAHDDSPSSYICIDIPPSFISYDTHSRIYLRYLAPILRNPVPPILHLSKHSQHGAILLKDLLDIQELVHSEKELIALDIRMKVMEIWKYTYLELTKCGGQQEYSFYDSDRLKTIISYIQEHYSEKISLDDIANEVSLSRSECSRIFKHLTGRSLFGYLTSYRINKSVDLIRDTDMSIAQIAAAVGFCSQSYYTDNFRKEKGITPKKFKLLSMRQANGVLSVDA